MLGVASEAAFDILFDAVKNALTDPNKINKLSRLEDEHQYKKINSML